MKIPTSLPHCVKPVSLQRKLLLSFSSSAVLAFPLAMAPVAVAQKIFSQDFESLTLGPNVDETALAGTNVWTKTPPVGWVIDDAAMPGLNQAGVGVTEWKGWSFASKTWWVTVAGDQRRGEFARGVGTVAIADPDEWDDKGSPAALGKFTSFLKTPAIDIAGLRANSLSLVFDSSFRPEDNQKASVKVSFNGGAPISLLEYVVTTDDKTNERLTIPIPNPATATSMVITWGMTDAGNNWFWAIDNIKVERTGPLFAENFDALPLKGDTQENRDLLGMNEAVKLDQAGNIVPTWTNAPPVGWAIDNSKLFKGLFDPDPVPEDPALWQGVTEWKGWTFANREWWATVAGNQRRSEFVKGVGNVAIADPDEWDDKDTPRNNGSFNSVMKTPPISLKGISAGSVILKFDSSWRPECCDDGPEVPQINDQNAVITISFDGGAPVEVMNWSSNPALPNFHNDDSTNESILVPIPNPAGAASMTLNFGLLNAKNDWWWAIDNVEVSAGAASLLGATGGPRKVVIDITDTGASRINTASLVLTIDGQAVPVLVTSAGVTLRVTHSRPDRFAQGSVHPFVLTGKDALGNPVRFEGTFSVPAQVFPVGPLPTPAGGVGTFGVRYIWSTPVPAGVGSGLEVAMTWAVSSATPAFEGKFFDTTHASINHGTGGFITDPAKSPYPDEVLAGEGWSGERFTMVSRGKIRITQPGAYTFGVHSDDGFGLRIFGAEFTSSSGGGIIDPGSPDSIIHKQDSGDTNTRATVTLEARDYDIEFLWYENGGGDFGELYAAKGTFATDAETSTWKLVGGEGGLPLIGAAVPPATFGIGSFVPAPGGQSFNLTFESAAAGTYQLQQATTLTSWTNFGGVINGAAGASSTTTNVPLSALPAGGKAFIRVKRTN